MALKMALELVIPRLITSIFFFSVSKFSLLYSERFFTSLGRFILRDFFELLWMGLFPNFFFSMFFSSVQEGYWFLYVNVPCHFDEFIYQF